MNRFVTIFFVFFLLIGPSAKSEEHSPGQRFRFFLHGVFSAAAEIEPATRLQKIRSLLHANGDVLLMLADPGQRPNILTQGGLPGFAKQLGPIDEFLREISVPSLQQWQKSSAPGRAKLIARIPDGLLLTFLQSTNTLLQHFPVSKLPGLEIVLGDIQKIDIPSLKPADRAFMAKAFLSYFDEVPTHIKRRMLIGWLSLHANAPADRQLGVVLQNAGPALQKFFQLLGKQAPSGALKEITAELLSNVKPVPFAEVKMKIESEYGKPLEEIFKTINEETLGSASVGQVYRAQTISGQEVIVKVIKPGVPADMAAEIEVLKRIMRSNRPAAELIDSVAANFLEELDLRHEAAGMERGLVYEDAKLGIRVPRTSTELAPREHVMVMSLAKGRPLAKSSEIDPRVRAQAVANVLDKWFSEVMFGTGFFHGDLHPGNIMIEPKAGKPGFGLTIIDFGGRGELSLEQRKLMLYFFAAMQDAKPARVLEALSGFGDLSNVDRAALQEDISSVLRNPNTSFELKMNETVGAALQRGAKLKSNMILFSRASLFLVNELASLNAEIKAKFPTSPLTLSEKIYARAAVRSMGRELLDHIRGRNGGKFFWDSELIRATVFSSLHQGARIAIKNCREAFGLIAR